MATTPTVTNRATRRSAANARRSTTVTPPPVQTRIQPADDDEALPLDDDTGPESDEDEAEGPSETKDDPQVQREISEAPTARRGAIALPQMIVDRSRQIEPGDMIMPKLLTSQAMSEVNREYMRSKGKQGVVAGDWYISTIGKPLGETVYFVPIDMQKSRGRFEVGKGLICHSYDLVQGVGDPGILCEGTAEEIATLPKEERGCEFRHWIREKGTSKPPPCGISFNFTGLLIDDIDDPETTQTQPLVLTLRATATTTAKAINTIVFTRGMGLWLNVILELSRVEKTNPSGTFFVPTATHFADTDEPGYARIRKRAESFSRTINPDAVTATLEADPAW